MYFTLVVGSEEEQGHQSLTSNHVLPSNVSAEEVIISLSLLKDLLLRHIKRTLVVLPFLLFFLHDISTVAAKD